jgi:dTMP kinase
MKIWLKMIKSKRLLSRFISFEGGEGAGKTSLINSVEKALVARGIEVIRTREPGGTPLGESIRSWLLDRGMQVEIGAKAELLLFLAARTQHINDVIAPAIKAGKVVLCDRFNDSTIAYQGAGRRLGIPWVTQLCEMVCGGVVPDLTFYLDVDPEIGLVRARNTDKDTAQIGQVDRIEAEKLSFHQDVRQAFLNIAQKNPKRFHVVDAHQSQTEVFDAVLWVLNEQSYFT